MVGERMKRKAKKSKEKQKGKIRKLFVCLFVGTNKLPIEIFYVLLTFSANKFSFFSRHSQFILYLHQISICKDLTNTQFYLVA